MAFTTLSGHSYFTQPGFVAVGEGGETLHEEFMGIDDAVKWCSARVACQSFSIKKKVEDGGHVFIRFYSSIDVSYDTEWVTYKKEPAVAYTYTFQSGFISGDTNLFEGFFTMAEAKRFCDSEAKCSGFTTGTAVSQNAEKLWCRFKSGKNVVFSDEWTSYTKTSKAPAYNTYFAQPGYLDAADDDNNEAWMSMEEARKHCNQDSDCAGFTVKRTTDGEPQQQMFTRFKSSPSVTYTDDWLSYTKSAPANAGYMFQPGYIEGEDNIHTAFMSMDAAKDWCNNNADCKGFTTFTSGDNRALKRLDESQRRTMFIRFKGGNTVVYQSDWISYTKSDAAVSKKKGGQETVSDYLYMPGYLGEGEQSVVYQGFMTLNEATKFCDKNSACKGFTVETPSEDPQASLYVTFKNSDDCTVHSGWTSYKKFSVAKGSADIKGSSYTFANGFLAEGDEMHSDFMSVQDAKKYCDARSACKGFSLPKTVGDPTEVMYTRFRSGNFITYDDEWVSYTKDDGHDEL